ncbi:MAG: hypothetical protein ACQCN6_06505 [Candidatus Bathyarchaeia archaeon]
MIDELSQLFGSKPSPHIIPRSYASIEKFIYYAKLVNQTLNYG